MTKLKENVNRLNALLKEGKIAEAFEKYYNLDVTIHIDGNPPITGKEQKREMIFLQEIEKLNNAEINSVTLGGIDDNVSMTEWTINLENKEGEK